MEGLRLLFQVALTFAIVGGGSYGAYRMLGILTDRPARQMQRNFTSLNPLRGKHRAQIVKVVGAPHSTAHTANGMVINRWVVGTYAIELHFDANGICEEAMRKNHA